MEVKIGDANLADKMELFCQFRMPRLVAIRIGNDPMIVARNNIGAKEARILSCAQWPKLS